jgi:hypothetical protein
MFLVYRVLHKANIRPLCGALQGKRMLAVTGFWFIYIYDFDVEFRSIRENISRDEEIFFIIGSGFNGGGNFPAIPGVAGKTP